MIILLGGSYASRPLRTLHDSVRVLTDIYGRFGVSINISGSADLPESAAEVIPDVLREAFANAVRHAYARSILVEFFKGEDSAGVIIRNRCIYGDCAIQDGRGLYDIKARVKRAGGTVESVRGDWFVLKLSFPLYQENDTRSKHNEGNSH